MFLVIWGPADLLQSASNVCCVMKRYPPREMTSPNDTHFTFYLYTAQNMDAITTPTLEMELAH